MDIQDKKKESLIASIKDAGYAIGLMYYESNKESLQEEEERSEYLLPDGRPNPNWLADGIGDQFSHSLNEIDDYIKLNPSLFGNDYRTQDDVWNLLDGFFDYSEVEEIAYEGCCSIQLSYRTRFFLA